DTLVRIAARPLVPYETDWMSTHPASTDAHRLDKLDLRAPTLRIPQLDSYPVCPNVHSIGAPHQQICCLFSERRSRRCTIQLHPLPPATLERSGPPDPLPAGAPKRNE